MENYVPKWEQWRRTGRNPAHIGKIGRVLKEKMEEQSNAWP
jgi:hypothetical protein